MKPDLHLTVQYGLAIFLSAFLLFLVQPLIGKLILPWFGGSASVWTTCMLFFQLILLLGYCYAHWVIRFLSPYRQSLLHGSLILIALLMMPIAASADWKPTGAENPTLRILGLLTVSIGLPYFVLSTTGPLLQAWFARERAGFVPYRLFALSNFGSMLALLAYPFAVEPVLSTRWQSWLWSGLFCCFALACFLLSWRGRYGTPIAFQHSESGSAYGLKDKVLWASLAACPSILMVADTSYLTTNIAPIPFIWVAPLALYLLSFILSFERNGWYRRAIFLSLFPVSLGLLACLSTLGINDLPIFVAMALNLSAFFIVSMVCHGELARLQPHPGQLTAYYLMLACGGAMGGFFVGVIAPYWFNNNYEFSIGILLSLFVASIAVISDVRFMPKKFRAVGFAVVFDLMLIFGKVCIGGHFFVNSTDDFTMRNFYGTLRVTNKAEDGYRTLFHGPIIHGRQFVASDKQDQPTTYYSADSGAGRALRVKAEAATDRPLRVGIIGLGVGTLVSYGRKGDYFRVYEIDPLVVDLARRNFSFLSRTAATTEVVLGDARLQLEREPSQQFDVLLVDAFSGDAIPIHLLTLEAFEQYFRHLKPNGILAVHISNRYLDLQPVVRAAADKMLGEMRVIDRADDPDQLVLRSRWALIGSDKNLFAHPHLATATSVSSRADFRPWRDDYSSIFSILK